MKRENLLMITGFSLLILTFAAASLNIWRRSANEANPNQQIIRLAHWQLEPPVRKAFEQIAKVYMAEHPGVTIEIIAVPERTYAQWFMTRLVGGFAPDLIEMRNNDSAIISRYFIPLTDWIEKPNPYNAGNPIADFSWRNTFIDGLDNDAAYHPQLLDYYGVPVSQFTNRFIYNRTLWRELLGNTPPPKTYAELVEVCQRFTAEAKKSTRKVVPFLSSVYHANAVYQRLSSSQTQKLTTQLYGSPLHSVTNNEFGLDYVRNRWSMDTPEIVSGLEIMRDVSTLFQPGYEAISREDCVFKFLQGGALMVYTGSWDYGSFEDQAAFDLGVFDLPVPAPGTSGYGEFVLGQPSEGSVSTSATFSLTRQSKYPEIAVDFLQFLTSQRGNRLFAEASGWLPAIVGVEPSNELKPFYPQLKGVRNGPEFSTLGLQNAGRVIGNERNKLLGPNGTVEAYRNSLKANLGDAIREDLTRAVIQQNKVVQRQDSVIAAFSQELRTTPENERLLSKLRENEESQTLLETLTAWTSLNLAEPVR
ncbi:ABC transporter substrate-binding protein [Rariglobus hedericola]|uniref:Extracellular solute-binding protein n=1 Tax=Rariglobus hedericola TaxID=2597822 RepID=A0A556QEL4_9BACT|nr:extracellular solute-binding protein [Rariglobus hedericola]TSJ75090.1 extracellular solute-binding protein [Rariglobus hedericola]